MERLVNCLQKRKDCFANEKGKCKALNNTEFINKPCPFYKPKQTESKK